MPSEPLAFPMPLHPRSRASTSCNKAPIFVSPRTAVSFLTVFVSVFPSPPLGVDVLGPAELPARNPSQWQWKWKATIKCCFVLSSVLFAVASFKVLVGGWLSLLPTVLEPSTFPDVFYCCWWRFLVCCCLYRYAVLTVFQVLCVPHFSR